ncbi:MAG: transcription termination/antitermination protein NusG [Elusimicrobiota bacterium]
MTTDAKWYVVHTKTNYEEKVKQALEKVRDEQNVKDLIVSVMVPTEDVMEIKKNKKQIRKRPFYPGYVFVKAVMDNATFNIIRNAPGVSGFLGAEKNKEPVPLNDTEASEIEELTKPSAVAKKPRPAVLFDKGEAVRINEGPFKHFVGVVEEVHEERAKLKVMVTIFGRPTPVELDFLQVEKV